MNELLLKVGDVVAGATTKEGLALLARTTFASREGFEYGHDESGPMAGSWDFGYFNLSAEKKYTTEELGRIAANSGVKLPNPWELLQIALSAEGESLSQSPLLALGGKVALLSNYDNKERKRHLTAAPLTQAWDVNERRILWIRLPKVSLQVV